MGCCGGGDNAGDYARQQEEKRQADIKSGLLKINSTFEGTRGVNPLTALVPGATVYDEYGQPVVVPQTVMKPQGSRFSASPSKERIDEYTTYQQQMADLQKRVAAGKLFGGKETSGGFDNAFYDKRKQDYLNFGIPQLAYQQKAAQKALSFSLARQGILHSGAAEQAGRDLSRQSGLGLQQVTDQATEQANTLRSNVEQERSRLINQLNATGDPNIASQQAVAAASTLRLPSTFAPIGNLFSDLTNQYVNKNLMGIWNNAGTGTGSVWGGGRVTNSAMPTNPSRII